MDLASIVFLVIIIIISYFYGVGRAASHEYHRLMTLGQYSQIMSDLGSKPADRSESVVWPGWEGCGEVELDRSMVGIVFPIKLFAGYSPNVVPTTAAHAEMISAIRQRAQLVGPLKTGEGEVIFWDSDWKHLVSRLAICLKISTGELTRSEIRRDISPPTPQFIIITKTEKTAQEHKENLDYIVDYTRRYLLEKS
jgi:hypothetical protein